MYGMITQVARDVDGDGKMTANSEDIFGWSGREFEYLPSLYSSGVSLIREDPENGGYVMKIPRQASVFRIPAGGFFLFIGFRVPYMSRWWCSEPLQTVP